MKLPFSQVDVFSMHMHRGNPVAVVHDADTLSDEQMRLFARWTNLSETTYLLSPTSSEADYRLRIFTPGGELPFAGHPTLGSCHAWVERGGIAADSNSVVQECSVGFISVRRDDELLWFSAPPLRRTGALDPELLARLLSALKLQPEEVVDHQWVDNGPGWCALLLKSGAQVRALEPDFSSLGGVALGVVGPQDDGDESDFEVRAFVPDLGVPEDPVTGSLNAGIAQWLIAAGHAPESYVAAQGTALERQGRVFVKQEGNELWIGGHAATCVNGEVSF